MKYLYVLATRQRNFGITLDSLKQKEKALAYLKKSYENFSILRSKNLKLYFEESIEVIMRLAATQQKYKRFDEAEQSVLDLQGDLLYLVNAGKKEEYYRYENTFVFLSKMFKDDSPNREKSMYYATTGLKRLDSHLLSEDGLMGYKKTDIAYHFLLEKK